MTAASNSTGGAGRSRYRQWFRLADHNDVDDATATTVRRRWGRHWGTAAGHGALCAAIVVMVHQVLTEISAPPISGVGAVVAVSGNLVAAAAFHGLLLAVGATTTLYGVVWMVETARGQCSRPIGALAVSVATVGSAVSVVALVHGIPAVIGWGSDSVAALTGAMAGTALHPLLSAEVTAQIAATMPWLAAATAIAATSWFGPHSGPKSNPFRGGRLDYRTVDATGYLPETLIDQYRNRKRGNVHG